MSDENKNSNAGMDPFEVSIDFEQIEQVSQAFFIESQEILAELPKLILKLEDNPEDNEQINVLFRKVHTLKGSVGAVPGGQLFGSLAHEFEALLNKIKREHHVVNDDCLQLFLNSSRLLNLLAEALREKREVYPEELSEAIELITRYGTFQFSGDGVKKAQKKKPLKVVSENSNDEGVWLSTQQFNEIVRLSGELLVTKNFFQMMTQTVNFRTDADLYDRRQTAFSQTLRKITEQFQSHVQEIRKEKVEVCFQGLNVLIRQASTELNKTVQMESKGMDLYIDKALGRDLYESLVHLVRNSIDHGIEDQFERTVEGKPSIGQLFLDIRESGGKILLDFRDDGKGLDKERILQRALKNGLVLESEVSDLTDQDIYAFIFESGFSTKDKVTTISGRGMGMDVVMTTVQKYGGEIQIVSQPGQGTTFSLSVPIPQNIMVESSLLSRWQNLYFAVPLTSVAHITSCDQLHITEVDRFRFCQFNGQTIPLLTYREMLEQKVEPFDKAHSSAIFIKVAGSVFALLVDRIEAQTDLVVKPFGKMIGHMKGFKGISVLADEQITYVVSPEEMSQMIIAQDAEKVAA